MTSSIYFRHGAACVFVQLLHHPSPGPVGMVCLTCRPALWPPGEQLSLSSGHSLADCKLLFLLPCVLKACFSSETKEQTACGLQILHLQERDRTGSQPSAPWGRIRCLLAWHGSSPEMRALWLPGLPAAAIVTSAGALEADAD